MVTEAHTNARPRRTTRASAAAKRLRVGDVLGGYRLCVELGTGGMASVYLGHGRSRSGVHRFAAVKCIRPELAADPQFVDMFLDEALIASQIHHPNVCNVFEFGQHHGMYFLAMELLAGQNLTAVGRELRALDNIALDVRAGCTARILEQVCEGLHAAHETVDASGKPLHVVHRDVSPDNLFVTYDGSVKVMDFGVAYASSRHHHTRTGTVKGKLSYVAPEVLQGKTPDRRADIWGLGVVAWETLAGKKLFEGPSDVAVLSAIHDAEIPPPSSLCPGLPARFDEIVMKALDRDPDRRYATARELGRALHRCLVDQQWSVGAAELSDLMRVLFPDGVDIARQQLQGAERIEAPPPPRARAAVLPPPLAPTPAPSPTPSPTPSPSTAVRALWSAPRWLLVLAIVACALLAGVFVGCRERSEPSPTAGITLEATPAGVDASGAMLLKIRVVPKS